MTEEKLLELGKNIDQLIAVHDINNLMAWYEWVHKPVTIYKTPECFALTMPDVSMEVSDWGVWKGAQAVTYLFGTVMKEHPIGTMFDHGLMTPYIEVSGDLETAKGTWYSLGVETQVDSEMTPHAFWSAGSYSVDFIKENGIWKIWHMKWWRTFRASFYKSWVEGFDDMMTGPPHKHSFDNAPITFFHPYDPHTSREPFPCPPEPYEAYEGTMSDWMFGKYKEQYFKNNTPVSQFEFAHNGKKAGEIKNNPSASYFTEHTETTDW